MDALRVLVVDEPATAAAWAARLTAWGYVASAASSAEEALAAAAADRPGAAVVNLSLPGRSGFLAARGLRRMTGGEGMLVIALSSHPDEAYCRLAEGAGWDRYGVKPVEPAALRAVLAMRRGAVAAGPGTKPAVRTPGAATVVGGVDVRGAWLCTRAGHAATVEIRLRDE